MIFARVFILILLFGSPAFSQGPPLDDKDAEEHFKRGNYPMAIKNYGLLLQKDPSNPLYNFNIGVSYLNTNIDKTLAIPHLEKALKTPQPDPEAFFYLGMAYQYALKFDEATEQYNKYKAVCGEKNLPKVVRQLETCDNARELIKHPLNVTFENLGPSINTEFPDYYPMAPTDESFIIFTTRRKAPPAVLEFDGHYSSDIYISNLVNGSYETAKNPGAGINTSYDEEAVGLSADGDQLFVYMDHIKEFGDIHISARKQGVFKKPVKQGPNVNTSTLETSASISADGNMLLFSSRRDGGHGSTDIYTTRKLPNGEWALPQNLGPAINTIYNEDFPLLMPDGKTLYFASQGHSSMGGYDLFISVFNEEGQTWSTPKNLGYPINNPENNMTIYFSEDKKIGYVSALRKEGMGDLDIYRVLFNESDQRLTLIRGNISSADTAIKTVPATITLTNAETQEMAGTYLPNPSSGNYVIIIPPGKYEITIEADGFKTLSENTSVHNSPLIPEIIKNYQMAPAEAAPVKEAEGIASPPEKPSGGM